MKVDVEVYCNAPNYQNYRYLLISSTWLGEVQIGDFFGSDLEHDLKQLVGFLNRNEYRIDKDYLETTLSHLRIIHHQGYIAFENGAYRYEPYTAENFLRYDPMSDVLHQCFIGQRIRD